MTDWQNAKQKLSENSYILAADIICRFLHFVIKDGFNQNNGGNRNIIEIEKIPILKLKVTIVSG